MWLQVPMCAGGEAGQLAEMCRSASGTGPWWLSAFLGSLHEAGVRTVPLSLWRQWEVLRNSPCGPASRAVL